MQTRPGRSSPGKRQRDDRHGGDCGDVGGGGALIVGIAINMLGLGREKIKVGNMLPAMFLPLVYFPISHVIGSLGP